MASDWSITPAVHWADIERETVHMRFDPANVTAAQMFDGEYQVRGALSVPLPAVDGGRFCDGVLMVAGRNVKTGAVAVFCEEHWSAVFDVLAGDGDNIEAKGCWRHFVNGWARYYCQTWYHGQTIREIMPYRLDIMRHPSVDPKPRIAGIDDGSADFASEAAIMAMDERGLLLYRAGGMTEAALQERGKSPEWRAFKALIDGYRRLRRP